MEPADFLKQLQDPERAHLRWDHLAEGLWRFSLGLFKKMLLADTFARAVDWGFANGVTTASAAASATSYDLLLVMLCYAFQIYFDFSGYTDMAIGIAKMMNIDLPENFRAPYQADSIRDFWKRWHMSLTSFLTRYLYIPLGGSRKGRARTCVNILIVFLISGLWHGASLTFLLWGFLHGLLQVLERLGEKAFRRIPRLLRRGYAFLSVSVLWLLFRAESIGDWLEMLERIFTFRYRIVSEELLRCFELPETRFLLEKLHLLSLSGQVRGFSMILFLAAAGLICLIPWRGKRGRENPGFFRMILAVVLFLWGFLCLGTESRFLYFNF